MQSETDDPIDRAVSTRRAELSLMPINDVRREFESIFGIHPTLSDGKGNLIDRVLAKFRAELRRRT